MVRAESAGRERKGVMSEGHGTHHVMLPADSGSLGVTPGGVGVCLHSERHDLLFVANRQA